MNDNARAAASSALELGRKLKADYPSPCASPACGHPEGVHIHIVGAGRLRRGSCRRVGCRCRRFYLPAPAEQS